MIICLCERVSDRTIRKVIQRGARSVEEITAACGAGATCQGCHPELETMLEAVTPVRIAVA